MTMDACSSDSNHSSTTDQMRCRTPGEILGPTNIPGETSSIVDDKNPRSLIEALRVTITVIDIQKLLDAIDHPRDQLFVAKDFGGLFAQFPLKGRRLAFHVSLDC